MEHMFAEPGTIHSFLASHPEPTMAQPPHDGNRQTQVAGHSTSPSAAFLSLPFHSLSASFPAGSSRLLHPAPLGALHPG